MKRLILAVSIVALGATGCDDDSGGGNADASTEVDAGSDGGGNGSGDRYPECTAADAFEQVGRFGNRWSLPKPWTEAQLEACIAVCRGDLNCFEAMCEGGTQFVDCYIGEVPYCAGDAQEATCPEEARIARCCVIDNECLDAPTDDQFSACVDTACGEDLDAFYECAVETCEEASLAACLTPGGFGSDAGADDKRVMKAGKLLQRQLNASWQRRYDALKAMSR